MYVIRHFNQKSIPIGKAYFIIYGGESGKRQQKKEELTKSIQLGKFPERKSIFILIL